MDANYNTLPIGAEPIWRYTQDSATYVTNVEMRYTFPADGKCTGKLNELEQTAILCHTVTYCTPMSRIELAQVSLLHL